MKRLYAKGGYLAERLVPVTETHPPRSRRDIYRLKDLYLHFWFCYAHPNLSQFERRGAQIILENHVIAKINHFSSLI